MRNVAIVGAGMTPFAEHFELGVKDLIPMAYAEAVAKVEVLGERSHSRAHDRDVSHARALSGVRPGQKAYP